MRCRRLSFFLLSGILLFGATSLSLARAPKVEKKVEKKAEKQTQPATAKSQPTPTRSSAIRERDGGTVRYVNRKGQTEVEVTSAISRKAIGNPEPVINRRDDGAPTITSPPPVAQANAPEVIIDIRRQKLRLVKGGRDLKEYPISTSRFGIGDRYHSYKTPVGRFKVDGKIGGNLPLGAVLKGGRFTGEVLRPNAPGRDPIVTRMIRLRGLEQRNANAYGRGIFIHGTPDEKSIGKAVSWGCVRMRSSDVIDLYARIGDGTSVTILAPEESPAPKSWFANLFSPDNETAAEEKTATASGT